MHLLLISSELTSFKYHSLSNLFFSEPVYQTTPYRKKKKGKGKKKGSDDSDSDDVEVIKEWNTSSRGKNGEGRTRRTSVEERKLVVYVGTLRPIHLLDGLSALMVLCGVF